MSFFFNQPDPKRRRFPIPNDVWKGELKPQGFAILAYLCYLHVHCNKNASPSADEIASQLHMSKDMAVKQIAELNRRGLLDQHMVPILKSNGKNFFSLPNELFFLNIGHGAMTVYAYLLYCENRRTHQCHPSCRTIAAAVHLSAATVNQSELTMVIPLAQERRSADYPLSSQPTASHTAGACGM